MAKAQRTTEEEFLFRARWGCLTDELDAFKKLVAENGDKVNTRDKYERTPIVIAAKRNQRDIMDTLIEHKADVNVVDERGNSAVMHATQQGHKEVVEALIAAGADLLIENKFGFTAELMAQKAGHKVVAGVCEKRADEQADAEENAEKLAAEKAKEKEEEEKEKEEMASSSKGKRTVPEELLFRARWGCLSDDLEEFKKVVAAAGEDKINTRDKYERTPLLIAAKRNQQDMLQLFVDNKAALDLKDERGNTAIMHAAQQGHKEVVDKLIEAGADLLVENQFGFTAELMAQKAGHKEIAEKCEKVADEQAEKQEKSDKAAE